MWPWEHALVGYLGYSLLCRLLFREAPDARDALAVGFGAVLPDLIDKPLSWEFGVFGTGYALGHSVFFALPFVSLVAVLARWRDRGRAGLAFAVGYLLHLPGDVLYNYAWDGRLRFDIVLWPVASGAGGTRPEGLFENTRRLLDTYLTSALAGEGSPLVWAQLGIAAAAVLVWLYDGAPLLREFLRGCTRIVRGVTGR